MATVRLKVTAEQARLVGTAAAAVGESAPEYVVGNAMVYGSAVMRALEAFPFGGPLAADDVRLLLDLKEMRAYAAAPHKKLATLTVGLADDKHLAHREHLKAKAKEAMAAA